MFSYEKLPGLPRERVLGAIEPVLRAHGLSGVELIWRMDQRGRVLQVTLERAESELPAEPGGVDAEGDGDGVPRQAGVTLDECSRVSRDLSTALDVADAIDRNYRLEVGTPGLDRRLYGEADFRRFAGSRVKLKLVEALSGQYVVLGELAGVDEQGRVVVELEGDRHAIALDAIRTAQLCVDWSALGFGSQPSARPGKSAKSAKAGNAGRRLAPASRSGEATRHK